MPSVTNCPTCNLQLRIPDELMGKQVKCPQCGTTFPAAPAPDSPGGGMPPMGGYGESAPGGYLGDPMRELRPAAASAAAEAVKAPAITLLIIGILSVLTGGYLIFNGIIVFAAPQLVEAEVKRSMEQQQRRQPGQPQPGPEEIKQITNIVGVACLLVGAIGLILSLVIILGAVRMMQLKSIGVAKTASVFAMLPVSCCCIVGLPVGIWALMVLGRPEVKSAFQ